MTEIKSYSYAECKNNFDSFTCELSAHSYEMMLCLLTVFLQSVRGHFNTLPLIKASSLRLFQQFAHMQQ